MCGQCGLSLKAPRAFFLSPTNKPILDPTLLAYYVSRLEPIRHVEDLDVLFVSFVRKCQCSASEWSVAKKTPDVSRFLPETFKKTAVTFSRNALLHRNIM